MSSPDFKIRLENAHQNESSYRPSAEVLQSLASKCFVMLVGPTQSGKTTVALEAAKIDSDFHYVPSTTNRQRRKTDPAGTMHYVETGQFDSLLADIDAGNLVQYAIHPTKQSFYGTYPQDYQALYNLMPTLATSVENLRQLPFKDIKVVAVVPTPTDMIARIKRAFGTDLTDDLVKRIHEGIISTEWLLAQPQGSILWLENSDGEQEIAANNLVELVKGQQPSDETCRAYTKRTHDLFKTMLETGRM